jgi:hypothetical protein
MQRCWLYQRSRHGGICICMERKKETKTILVSYGYRTKSFVCWTFESAPSVLRREEVNIVQERRLKKKAQREMATNTIANDVKTSLQSLEAVRLKSINSERLSSDDIQSARSNLNDIIRTAESIKENLNSSENAVSRNATDDEHDGDEGSSSVEDEEIRTEQNTIASSSEVSEAPKRRLSTPCCIPSPVTDMRVSTSIM